ncbi:MAG TPA: hypothetical protein DCS83_05370 [Prevotella sp.]|nr:hypothetical protein [Prevotella sp.]
MKIHSNSKAEYRIINIFLLFVFLLASCCTVKKIYQFRSYDFEKMYKILYDSYDSQNWSKIENEISSYYDGLPLDVKSTKNYDGYDFFHNKKYIKKKYYGSNVFVNEQSGELEPSGKDFVGVTFIATSDDSLHYSLDSIKVLLPSSARIRNYQPFMCKIGFEKVQYRKNLMALYVNKNQGDRVNLYHVEFLRNENSFYIIMSGN